MGNRAKSAEFKREGVGEETKGGKRGIETCHRKKAKKQAHVMFHKREEEIQKYFRCKKRKGKNRKKDIRSVQQNARTRTQWEETLRHGNHSDGNRGKFLCDGAKNQKKKTGRSIAKSGR